MIEESKRRQFKLLDTFNQTVNHIDETGSLLVNRKGYNNRTRTKLADEWNQDVFLGAVVNMCDAYRDLICSDMDLSFRQQATEMLIDKLVALKGQPSYNYTMATAYHQAHLHIAETLKDAAAIKGANLIPDNFSDRMKLYSRPLYFIQFPTEFIKHHDTPPATVSFPEEEAKTNLAAFEKAINDIAALKP
jgi:hypothetical protein